MKTGGNFPVSYTKFFEEKKFQIKISYLDVKWQHKMQVHRFIKIIPFYVPDMGNVQCWEE